MTGPAKELTDLARRSTEPANATRRQYEALRADFIEGLSGVEAARRFGSTPGSFRGLVHQSRREPDRPSFIPPAKGPHAAPKSDPLRARIIELREQDLSIYDISRALHDEGRPLGPVAVSQVPKAAGFARLPRRADDGRPPGPRPITADVADVRRLDLAPRHLRTRSGGRSLSLPTRAAIPVDRIAHQAGRPGSRMIPAGCALRSPLALELFGTARHPQVMSAVLDEGSAPFAGLNTIPERPSLTEYSCRIDPACYPELMRRRSDAMSGRGLRRGGASDLDSHAIPHHGDDAPVEEHYASKRGRRRQGVLAFLARDAGTRVSCYADAELREAEQGDEVLRFVRSWERRAGHSPEELIFDSELTTEAKRGAANRLGINFITLRRRPPKLLEGIHRTPPSAWRRIESEGVSRTSKHPRILDRRISLRDYDGPLRQLTVADLGHDGPTSILTNQLTRPAAQLIGRDAQRMIVEDTIEDGIEFVPMGALSSAVAMKVNCDLQKTRTNCTRIGALWTVAVSADNRRTGTSEPGELDRHTPGSRPPRRPLMRHHPARPIPPRAQRSHPGASRRLDSGKRSPKRTAIGPS